MNLSEKLYELRKKKGISQETLAEELDVSRQAVSKWEGGQSLPETEKLIKLSDYFGVSLDYLLKEPGFEESVSNNIPDFIPRYNYSYEYKSKRKLFGLPLVHINLGRRLPKAKGIIAIGGRATGLISVGLLSKGLLSFGALSLGLFSLGALSLGLLFSAGAISIGIIAAGAVAVGVLSFGALSIGVFSAGACAFGSHYAIGDHAYAHIAVGRVAKGTITFLDSSPGQDFSLLNKTEIREAVKNEFPGIWKWIINLYTSMIGS